MAVKKKVRKSALRLLVSLPATSIEALIDDLENAIGIGDGRGEQALIDLLPDFFDREITVFDVGANVGQYSQMLRNGLDGRTPFSVHAFEPNLVAAERYEAAVSDPRFILNRFALSSSEGNGVLYADRRGSSLASLHLRYQHQQHDGENYSELVKLKTIDGCFREIECERIDFLKIDVEGHEIKVLEGATKTAKRGCISLIQFEFGGACIDSRVFFRDIFRWAEDFSYSAFRITPDGEFVFICRYSESDEKFQWSNFLLLRKNIRIPSRFLERVRYRSAGDRMELSRRSI